MGYIYKITNTINDKIYIGQTNYSIKKRWKDHVVAARNLSRKYPLYLAMYKYGVENFTIEVIEECDNSILNEREIYWIKYYNSYKHGYNATIGGLGKPTYILDDIKRLWDEGKLQSEISQILNIHPTTVNKAIKDLGITHEEVISRVEHKEVEQYDLEGNFIKRYYSANEAAKAVNLKNGGSITQACKGNNYSAKGYLWKYAFDETPIEVKVQQYKDKFNKT